jgi:hypothetical protein
MAVDARIIILPSFKKVVEDGDEILVAFNFSDKKFHALALEGFFSWPLEIVVDFTSPSLPPSPLLLYFQFYTLHPLGV